ncbi:microcephalin [Anabrus simplex]|uniref:microcephalin n=1 Tax=Anabrus simplex TaxID=316456 RepID=UPI0035A31EB1
MESTPRRAKKRKSSAGSLLNISNYDVFADCAEFSPIVGTGDRKVIPLLTPQRSVRENSSRNSRKSCDISFLHYDLSSPVTPRRSDRDASFRSPLSERQKLWSSESQLLPRTPAPLGSNSCNDVNRTPSSNTVEMYKAILEGKKVVEEILQRSKKKAKPIPSPGSILTPDSSKVNGITRLFPEETPGKEPAAQSVSLPSRRYIDYSDCPQSREGASECSPNTSLNNSISDVNLETYDDLPPTQPVSAFILKDVVAYVEVRTSVDKEAKGVKDQLRMLGAVVANSFNKKVTHVIFMNGKMSTYKKAVERKVPLVSVLWIEECKRRKVKVSERLYPSSDIEKLESPQVLETNTKKPFFPSLRDLKRKLTTAKRRKKEPNLNVKERENIEPAKETFQSRESLIGPKWAKEAANGNGLVQALISVAKFSEEEFKEIVNKPNTPEASDDEIPGSPLAVRLLRKLVSPKVDRVLNTPCNKDTSNQLQTVVNTNENAELISKSHYELTSDDTGLDVSGKINTKLCHNADLSVLTCKRNSLTENNEPCQIPTTNSDASPSACSKIIAPKRLISALEETHSINERSQDSQMNPPDIAATQLNNSERRGRKRKLLPLTQNPTILTPTDDEPPVELTQNPYISEKHLNRTIQRQNARRCSTKLHGSVALSQCKTQSPEEMAYMVSYSRRKSRTSFEFVAIQRRRSQRIIMTSQSNTTQNTMLPTVVCTGLHSEEVGVIMRIVNNLGKYEVEDHITARTTHVITKEPKRTLKLLKGMARGCWIVKQEWVLRSLEEGKWLDEEEFEMIEFSPAVQQYRLEKISFGPAYKPDLFTSCGPIYVKKSGKNSPPKEDIEELVVLCGGKITSSIHSAEVVIGQTSHSCNGVVCVSVQWILDSISRNKLEAVETYTMHTSSSS